MAVDAPARKSLKVVPLMVLRSPSVVLASIASVNVALTLTEGATPVAPATGTVLFLTLGAVVWGAC